ncbi:MAG TPA: phosphoribosylformylglycinamidine synthase [Bacillota bacterium]|jgi:phosphoribosylformylglycinamidine synthase|nr:phosphoribosylformylglycinamidine synthase [Bacillota bacterium]HPT68205.1 phosphoribosylformylglycinamidine synthase [Bacillota bacterium]
MQHQVRRIFVEKKPEFAVEARMLYNDLHDFLGIKGLTGVRIINRYDIEGITEAEYLQSRETIFAEPTVDLVYDESFPLPPGDRVIAVEYLPGQYDQRADSAAQCIQILTQGVRPEVRCAKLILLSGDLSEADYAKIKNYCINPLESREAALEKPETLEMKVDLPENVPYIAGFTGMSREELDKLRDRLGLAMSMADLEFTQDYFKNTEQRDPSLTEIRVLDTYWSDHCRHTTFLTEIKEVEFAEGQLVEPIKEAYQAYLNHRQMVYGDKSKDICLMDIATLGMKALKKQGLLNDLDESEEINACSIKVKAEIDGETQEWLVMFKNETHNHPTEIEPFGGAATCLGGAIRDPLSGRSYVYHAMRVTGSGDPRTPVEETLPGKLPQRKITTGAAAGFSSYGNQIGLATGQVAEIYDEDYVAKRMEIGAVIGAAPAENVVRARPQPGDVVILLGGRTGRDGCGGATGSSKEHTEESLFTCGAEVQKGNPPTERKLQRLFRDPAVSRMIKRCNDFGAGGVSVAIGELADSLEINLDAVPKKYEGLDGTELAISESQERMAVVIAAADLEAFIAKAMEENLEATLVAVVTDTGRLRMKWRGQTIVDISREFLNTNGAKQNTRVRVLSPQPEKNALCQLAQEVAAALPDLKAAWLANLGRLNVCSQKGLVERFDSSIGAGSVLMPFGGERQLTPVDGMVAKLPVLTGETTTGTLMTYGYSPAVAKWSPFHGAVYAIVESVAKAVALGADYRRIRLTLQEYFEKLGTDDTKWGKPFSALLGSFLTQISLGIPAIGGKDSMSGTFKDMNVPPTLVSFALDVVDVTKVISPELKTPGSLLVFVPLRRDANDLPDFADLKVKYGRIHELIVAGKILAAHAVGEGGIAAALSKMAFGNHIGLSLQVPADRDELFRPEFGSLVLEIAGTEDPAALFAGIDYKLLGKTQAQPVIAIGGEMIDLDEALAAWEGTLEKVFPTRVAFPQEEPATVLCTQRNAAKPKVRVAKPVVFIPIFPGTNCEYDTARRFEKAGGRVETLVFKNLSPAAVEASVAAIVNKINNAQIVMIPGGFSAGDEPEGSGKFIATVFRNPAIKDAIMKFLKERDGLMLGICNGFQALIKLGLVPYGEIRDIDPASPTLTFNTIGRHVSCMVRTKVVSTLSPWLAKVEPGEIHWIPVSHGEGRFVADEQVLHELARNGQIATAYVDLDGNPTYDIRYNPNGSMWAIEGITSPDGRVFGKMGHSERIGRNVAKNIPGHKNQRIFEAGVEYFL